MKRSRLALVAAGTLGLAATLLTSGLTMTASAAPVSTRTVTQETTFNPWTAAGELPPGIKVSERVHASGCTFGSSYDVGNGDAWRCFQSDGEVYDPCFAPAGRSHVTQGACMTNPWGGKALILTLG